MEKLLESALFSLIFYPHYLLYNNWEDNIRKYAECQIWMGSIGWVMCGIDTLGAYEGWA